jgi:cytidylate kinase
MALITITSNIGSGGINVARLVSERLGIQLFDNSQLREMISSVGMSGKDLEGLDEKSPGLLDRLFNNKPGLYMDLLGSTVYDIASKGEGVVVGHGAQFFLKDFNCAFHVMIHASEQTRINRLMQEQNIDESSATKIIHKMDKRINSFVQYAFNRDMNDVSMYDIVINLDKIDKIIAVNTIADISQSEKIKSCSLTALDQMKYTSLQRKINAEFIT